MVSELSSIALFNSPSSVINSFMYSWNVSLSFCFLFNKFCSFCCGSSSCSINVFNNSSSDSATFLYFSRFILLFQSPVNLLSKIVLSFPSMYCFTSVMYSFATSCALCFELSFAYVFSAAAFKSLFHLLNFIVSLSSSM